MQANFLIEKAVKTILFLKRGKKGAIFYISGRKGINY